MDPSGARIGAILQSLAAGRSERRPQLARAWLAADQIPPQLQVLDAEQPTVVMMMRTLGSLSIDPPLQAHEVLYPISDVV
jgi:hypothetical protein